MENNTQQSEKENNEELSKRKHFLLEKNLEQLQEDYMNNTHKQKLSVKIRKTEEHQAQISIQTCSIPQAEYDRTSKKKSKKKDIISIDNPLANSQSHQQRIQNTHCSIFKQSLQEIKQNLSAFDVRIEKDTGLPKTFIIDTNMKKIPQQLEVKVTTSELISVTENKQSNDVNDEYTEIHKQNVEKISKMTKDELIGYQQMIKAKIPGSLVNKMKGGYFQKKLKAEMSKINSSENTTTDSIAKNHPEPEQDDILRLYYSYSGGKILQKEKPKQKIENDVIDYSSLKFHEMELDSKFFTVKEIYALLCSSSDHHILIALKLLKHLIRDTFEEAEVSDQLWQFIQALYHLVDHKNIQVRSISIEMFSSVLEMFYRQDVKAFTYNWQYFNNFPAVKIYTLPLNGGMKKEISVKVNQCKKDLTSLIQCNFERNFLHCSTVFSNLCSFSEGMQRSCLSVFFYYVYLSEDFLIKYFHSNLESNLKVFMNGALQDDTRNQLAVKQIKKIFIQLALEQNVEEIDEYLQETTVREALFQVSMFIKLLRSSATPKYFLIESGSTCSAKSNLLDLCILMKWINSNNIEIYSENIQEFLSTIKFDTVNLIKGNVEVDHIQLLNISKYLLVKIKMFKCQPDDENYFILNTKDQIEIYENAFNDIITFYLTNGTSLPPHILGSILEFWNSIVLFAYYSFKYPKSIHYLKPFNHSHLLQLFPILSALLNKIQITETDERLKVQILYLNENLLKVSISLLRCFIKNYSEVYDLPLAHLLTRLPNIVNSLGEYYYHKIIKCIQVYFHKKISRHKEMESFITRIHFNYDALLEDLNFYLSSNEDLRKSSVLKRVMYYFHESSPQILIHLDPKNSPLPFKEKSKFFPLGSNFILQVLYNEKMNSQVKLNYIALLIVFYYKELNPEWNFFEIFLKTVIHLDDQMPVWLCEEILSEYVERLLLCDFPECEVRLRRSSENEYLMESYYEKLDSTSKPISCGNTILLLLMLIFHHKSMICSRDYILPKHYTCNFSLSIFCHFFEIVENFSSIRLLQAQDMKEKIIQFIIGNLSLINSEIYETLILTYLKHCTNSNEFPIGCSENFLIQLISALMSYFQLDENNKTEIYQTCLANEKFLSNRIIEKLSQI